MTAIGRGDREHNMGLASGHRHAGPERRQTRSDIDQFCHVREPASPARGNNVNCSHHPLNCALAEGSRQRAILAGHGDTADPPALPCAVSCRVLKFGGDLEAAPVVNHIRARTQQIARQPFWIREATK